MRECMQIPTELLRDDADRFSDQLRLLQMALQQANQAEPARPRLSYRETGVPNCSPTRPPIN